MLHIHNGGSTANTLKEFGFPGEHKAFQEVLMAGPAPRGLSPVEWREMRTKFLADAYELKHEECRNSLIEQEANLRGFAEHDETILWFEYDLKGAIGFKSLFPAFRETEPAYGMGDLQFWCELKRLAKARKPLITISGLRNDESAFKSNKFHDAWCELTETGQTVLAGRTDFVDINGIDLWLGGVHLVDDEVWRWDQDKHQLARRSS